MVVTPVSYGQESHESLTTDRSPDEFRSAHPGLCLIEGQRCHAVDFVMRLDEPVHEPRLAGFLGLEHRQHSRAWFGLHHAAGQHAQERLADVARVEVVMMFQGVVGFSDNQVADDDCLANAVCFQQALLRLGG